ncbi:MAG: Ppx/GppA family phosphatase [Methanomassiliicoccales archaeon]|nr:Ppx/GppA family phosphatase [Methanomassiliicoccales archaeon]
MDVAGKVVEFIDLGTNSIRAAIVRLNPNFSFTVLSMQKEVARLGEREFLNQELIPEAMDRAILVCKHFVGMGKSYGVEESVALCTSATRDARNQAEFLERLKAETGLDFKIISGLEEARLIYLGVSNSIDLGGKKAVFIDVGGGSTEVSVGDQRHYLSLDTLNLGAIRLTTLFIPPEETGPIFPEKYSLMKKSVRNKIVRTVQRVKKQGPEVAVASSGTAINLAQIAARNFGGDASTLTLGRLKRTVALLSTRTLEERRKVPGINPERADIIVGGAAILETLMEEIGIQEVRISEAGLLDGMIFDYLSRIEGFPSYQSMGVRERSVLQLARSFGTDEVHAETIKRISLELFDSAKEEGIHSLGKEERELLGHAAYLHDIGDFISFTDHQAHSYYIIRNAELLGFSQNEINIMANLAKFHRKKAPGKRSEELDEPSLSALQQLSTFLKLAESLDRSHCNLIQHSRFIYADKDKAMLEVVASGDCQLEVWGAESHAKGFKKVFHRELTLRVRTVGPLD